MAIETDINQALLDDIYAIYSQAETEMLEKIAKRVAKGITTEGWNEKKLSEVQELKKDIEKTIKTKCYEGQALISEDIISAYTKGKISATMDAGKKAKKTSSINMSGITNKKLKESIQTAFDYAKGMEGLPQDPDTMFKKVVYATGNMEAKMLKTNAGAQVIGDTIYVCKPYQKYIDDEFIMHEIGHKATKFGLKTTDSTQKKEAEALAKKLGYKDVKSMSLYISDYAAKNPTEFYPEALMEYYKSLKTGKPLMGNKKKIIEAAIEQMYNDPKKKKQIHEDVVKFAKGVHTSVLDEFDIPMNLKQLILATNKLLNNASFQILRNAEDAYTQIMSNATTGLLSGVDTRIQASQKMLNEMSVKGITSFVDKAGRSWSLSSYAEMCVRTVGAHAALQGHIDRQLEVGEDLVKVSTIGTTCPICQRWQGVVLSISGKSPKYHGLDEAKAAGLFHPNCKHTLGMYIPELDEGTVHEGKVEPEPINMKSKSSIRNDLIQQQRANERKIRYWKDRASVALSNEEKSKCLEKVKYWQHTNLLHCEKNGLRRQYAREKTYFGNANGPVGAPIGGHLKDYESLYKDVIGADPKQVFKESKKIYGSKEVTFEKWLKDEIQSLDQLDIDKAQMKDANNKAVTPTSLYKKYIGDSPMQDYTQVAEFEKGTKEFKSQYAKWLKTQIEEIGVSYKIKPQYTEVHEDIPEEDTKLSATEIYKKYHDGEKPTDAYKKLGGEEGTGMKYGKWVENQKKELIKNGIIKTVPFNAATDKTAKVIASATSTIQDAKLVTYKAELDNTVTGAYTGSQAVKKAYQELKDAQYDGTPEEWDLAEKKYEIAKQKHVEMVKKKAQKSYGTPDFAKEKQELLDKLLDMAGDDSKADIHAHIDSQYKAYEEVEAEKKAEAKQAAKLKKIQEAELKKKIAENGGLLPDDKVIEECTNQKLSSEQGELKKKLRADMKKALKEMGATDLRMGSRGTCYFDIHVYYGTADKQKAIDNMTPWQAVGDYTSGSRPHNFAYKENQSAKNYFNGARYTREQAQYIDTILDRAFEVPSATMKEMCVVRHGNDEDGLIGLLGDDLDYENYSHSMFIDRLKELNQKTQSGESVLLNETGYLSTSPFSNGGFTDKRVELRILCPAGTKGLYVDDFSYYGGEEEIILKRNQKFKFVKAYSKDIDSDEFNKLQSQMSGSGTSSWSGTSTIIYLQAIPE